MRRARLGIKPNLGPKGPGAVGDTPKPKITAPATSIPKPGNAETKTDFSSTTQNASRKSVDTRSSDHSPAPHFPNVKSPGIAATESADPHSHAHHTPARVKSPRKSVGADHIKGGEVKLGTSPGPRKSSVEPEYAQAAEAQLPASPRKSATGAEQSKASEAKFPASPRKLFAGADQARVLSSAAVGDSTAAPPSPARVRSPRKSVGGDSYPVTTNIVPQTSTPVEISSAVSSRKGPVRATSPVKKAPGSPGRVSSSTKNVVIPVVRGARSRFAKVRPNLSLAVKTADKPAAAKTVVPPTEKHSSTKASGKERELEETDGIAQDTSVPESKTSETPKTTENGSSSFISSVPISSVIRLPSTSTTAITASSPTVGLAARTPPPPPTSSAAPAASSSAAVGLLSSLKRTQSSLSTDNDVDNDSECGASVSNASVDQEMFDGQETPSEAPSSPSPSLSAATHGEHRKHDGKKRKSRPVLPPSDVPPDRTKMKMSDFIYWNSARNHMSKKEEKKPARAAAKTDSVDTTHAIANNDEASNGSSDSLPVPELKIGPDGNIIINTESLMMAKEVIEEPTEVIEEDEYTRYKGSKYKRPARWSKDETTRFFKALSIVGTDFTLMRQLLPRRSREDLKNKFSKEEKHNRPLVDQALRERQGFNKDALQQAKEEDAAEKMRMDKMAEEKKKKKLKKKKEEDDRIRVEDEEEAEDGEEEAGSEKMEADAEERKENGRKRRIALSNREDELTEEGGTTLIKKRRGGRAPKGHMNEEVADILVNMSKGQGKRSPRDIDEESFSAEYEYSLSSTHDDSSVFIPSAVRPKEMSLQSPGSHGVVVDSVADLVVPMDGLSAAPQNAFVTEYQSNVLYSTTTAEGYLPYKNSRAAVSTMIGPGGSPRMSAMQMNNAQPLSTLQTIRISQPESEIIGQPVHQPVSQPASQNLNEMINQLASPQRNPGRSDLVTDMHSLIHTLQVQSSTPVDVVLVEQRMEGQEENLVHVYLVPRNTDAGEGITSPRTVFSTPQGFMFPSHHNQGIMSPRGDSPSQRPPSQRVTTPTSPLQRVFSPPLPQPRVFTPLPPNQGVTTALPYHQRVTAHLPEIQRAVTLLSQPNQGMTSPPPLRIMSPAHRTTYVNNPNLAAPQPSVLSLSSLPRCASLQSNIVHAQSSIFTTNPNLTSPQLVVQSSQTLSTVGTSHVNKASVQVQSKNNSTTLVTTVGDNDSIGSAVTTQSTLTSTPQYVSI